MRWLGLMDDDELGKFRLERTAKSATYRGPKNYSIGDDEVVSGRKETPLKSGSSWYIQDEQEQLDSILGAAPDGTIVVRRRKKMIPAPNPMGVWWSDGRVTPAVLNHGVIRFLPPGQEAPRTPSKRTRK